MKQIEYNLLEERWVRVRGQDYTVQEVSLPDALLHAHEYRDLAGELPTQDAAMLRLLLAVLHTVFSRVDGNGTPAPFEETDDALIRWEELYRLGHFPEAPVRAYLEQWRDRFWLFHPERPFWQVPEAKIGTEYTASKLNGELSESSNKLRLFSSYAGEGKEGLTYAQAARWLLSVNGYDDTSAKPKGKGLPSVGAGWLGKLGYIQAQGSNLFETLMLNLTLLKDGVELWGENHPCWELDEPRSAERTEIALPDNPAQLLTLQSRRLLLDREGEIVTGFSLLGGDFFPRENAFAEQMTVWRDPDAKKSKKTGQVTFVPSRHDPAKQFWREFPAVFCEEGESVRRPGVVRWVEMLQNDPDCPLERKQLIRFAISGMKYGDKDFFVNDSFSDSLTFQAALLGELGRRWTVPIRDEIGRCEQAAQCVGRLAWELSLAAGDKNDTTAESARTQFYFTIDQPFRLWLQSIDPETDKLDEKADEWQEKARKLAAELGRQMVERAGNAAFVGHRVEVKTGGKKDEKKTVLCTAPKAYNSFLYNLRKLYPKKEGGTA
jgi:CRISPR system Cascade subunit CasA